MVLEKDIQKYFFDISQQTVKSFNQRIGGFLI